MEKKRLISSALVATMVASLVSGCGSSGTSAGSSQNSAQSSADGMTEISLYRATFNQASSDATEVGKIQDAINDYIGDKIHVKIKQTNHEGLLVDYIQEAFFDQIDGIIINPAAYTHTSVAILDALKAVKIPCVEVHISNPDEREAYRQVSYVREACLATIKGKGLEGYLEAIDKLISYI